MKILIALLLLISSANAQVNLGAFFVAGFPGPIDGRTVVADDTARNAIVSSVRYVGLTTYVIADRTYYSLIGGTSNSNWVVQQPGGGIVVVSTFSSPTLLTSGGTFTVPTSQRTRVYVAGNGAAVVDPVLTSGSGTQELYLLGTSATNTITLTNNNSGNNLIMSGSIVLRQGSMICLHWASDASLWIEDHRNEM